MRDGLVGPNLPRGVVRLVNAGSMTNTKNRANEPILERRAGIGVGRLVKVGWAGEARSTIRIPDAKFQIADSGLKFSRIDSAD